MGTGSQRCMIHQGKILKKPVKNRKYAKHRDTNVEAGQKNHEYAGEYVKHRAGNVEAGQKNCEYTKKP